MARIKQVFLSGKLNNMILYDRLGTPCMRSMPEKVRQTTATKQSAKTFGKAASIAKFLREGLAPVLTNIKGRDMEYRLNNAVGEWLRSSDINSQLYPLSSFQLNNETSLTQRLLFSFNADWKKSNVILNIPAINPFQQIKAPAHTTQVHWNIVITGSMISDPQLTASYSITINMDRVDSDLPARQIELPYVMKPESINVIALAIKYSVVKKGRYKSVSDKRWTPAGIVGAKYFL